MHSHFDTWGKYFLLSSMLLLCGFGWSAGMTFAQFSVTKAYAPKPSERTGSD